MENANEKPVLKVPVIDLTAKLAADLAGYAQRPVQIVLCGGGFAEQTFGDASSSKTIKISMNPDALKGVRKFEQAAAIWRGIGFYRLLNSLNDVGPQLELAAKAGIGSLFSVLNDEHNQRRAAASNKELDGLLQTLCAHRYRGNNKTAALFAEGESGAKGFESHGDYRARFEDFAYLLRRHLQPSSETGLEVVEALSLVPENLKDLSKEEVLNLASSIHVILSRGLEAPAEPAVVLKKVKAEDVPESEPEIDFFDEPDLAVEEELADIVSPADKRWWQRLFKSKVSYVVLGSFAMGWLIFLLKAGVDFWMAIAGLVVVALLLVAVAAFAGVFSREKKVDTGSKWDWRTSLAWFFSFKWLPFRLHWPWRRGEGFRWPFSFNWNLDGLSRILSWPGIVWRGFINRVVLPVRDFIVAFARGFVTTVRVIFFTVKNFLEDLIKSKASRYVFGGICKISSEFAAWTKRSFVLMWRHSTFRLFLLALPVAVLIAIVIGMAMLGSELVLWQILVVGAIWLVVLALGYFYLPQIKAWVIADVYAVHQNVESNVAIRLPVDKTTTTFTHIEEFHPVDANTQFLAAVIEKAVVASEPLKESLRRCGFVTASRDNMSEGFDLVDDIEMAQYTGDSQIFVDEIEKPRTSLHFDVLVDCSSSQEEATTNLRKGEKFLRSKAFALAIEEAIRGRRGVSGRLWGYDDKTIYDCGVAGDNRISGLTVSGGGNNDAGALFQVTQTAGGKSKRVVVIISDAQPADCSWGALHELGFTLMRQGVTVVQVLTEDCDDPALSWHVVDIYSQSLSKASSFLGRILEAQLVGK